MGHVYGVSGHPPLAVTPFSLDVKEHGMTPCACDQFYSVFHNKKDNLTQKKGNGYA
jgi:hypothetical protein